VVPAGRHKTAAELGKAAFGLARVRLADVDDEGVEVVGPDGLYVDVVAGAVGAHCGDVEEVEFVAEGEDVAVVGAPDGAAADGLLVAVVGEDDGAAGLGELLAGQD